MLQKIVWTGLVTLLSAASAALAVRAADRLWRTFRHAPPPPLPKWAKLAVGKPIKSRIERGVAHVPL